MVWTRIGRAAPISSDRVSSLKYPICVTGMGRSGTSLTTALIGILGVYLGPEENMLQPAEHDNAKGYWEQREIYEINEEVLQIFGGTWERPPHLPQHWERSPFLADTRHRASKMLSEMFGDASVRWAWKDPRSAVTLPFWRSLIGNMDYVLCVRKPADVANSIAARGSHHLDFDRSVALWYHYTQAALDNTQTGRRLILNYEDYFLNPDHQIQRLAEFICDLDAPSTAEHLERLRRFIEPELWHNRDSVEGTIDVRAVSIDTHDLYTRLSIDHSPLACGERRPTRRRCSWFSRRT